MVEMASHLSGKHLNDFDWKANVTLASSTASSLQIPSLQVCPSRVLYSVHWLEKNAKLRDLSACSVHRR